MVGGPGRREVAAVDVEAGVLLLPLGPAVLEPDLHLNKSIVSDICMYAD